MGRVLSCSGCGGLAETATLVGAALAIGIVVGCTTNDSASTDLPPPAARISNVLGYTYFVAWILSFVPQLALNARRRSVVGMSIDSAVLSTCGFLAYAVYTAAVYWSPAVRIAYAAQYGGAPVVTAPDVFFCVWALAMEAVALTQIAVYDRGTQGLARLTLAAAVALLAGMAAVVIACGASDARVLSWPTALVTVSWIKVGVTIVRYLPQIWLNGARGTTHGFKLRCIVSAATRVWIGVATTRRLRFAPPPHAAWRRCGWT